jgi:hypothetical protein
MKQCPRCTNTCEDNDVICSKCGFLFTPAGFGTQGTGNEQKATPNQENIAPNPNFDQPQYPGNNAQNAQYSQYSQYSQSPFQGENNRFVAPRRNNGLAVAALVLGILGVVFACCDGIGAIFGILSLIFGIISMKQLKKSSGVEKGQGMALAGIIMGSISIIIGAIFIAYLIANRGQIADMLQQFMQSYQSSLNS